MKYKLYKTGTNEPLGGARGLSSLADLIHDLWIEDGVAPSEYFIEEDGNEPE